MVERNSVTTAQAARSESHRQDAARVTRGSRRLKSALVTGGTRGIGRAIAEELTRAGLRVLVTGTAGSGRGPRGATYHACDFSDEAALERFAREVAAWKLDILVNNAGINRIGELSEYRTDDFEQIQRVNVTAPFVLCRAVVPGMQQRRFGRIVNITSIYGNVSRAGRSAYSTSKFGLFGLTRALALEVASYNILVNCLAPGFVETDMTRTILGKQGMAEMAAQVPMKRMARPEEIARYVRFLVSDENTYMTGQQVIVDGGFTCA